MYKPFLVFVLFFQINNCLAQINPCKGRGPAYSSLPGDTTIVLKSGTTLTFNRCEFFDLRNCIEIIEITDTADLRSEGINMYDKDGNILITCGMLRVNFKNCDKPCLDVPVKIKMRIRFQDCSNSANRLPNLYINNNGKWEKPKDDKSKITVLNNERFLELETKCSILINCDVPKKGRKVKFIVPKGNKVASLRIGTTCPLFYSDTHFDPPKRKIKLMLLCKSPELTEVQTMQVSSVSGNQHLAKNRLSELKHGSSKLNCNEKRRFNLFGWLKRSRSEDYKKYFLQ